MNIRKVTYIILFILLMFISLTNVNASNYGVRVNSDGTLSLNGKYFKAMGLNDVDLVWDEGKYTDSDFEILSNNKIPFIRVAFGGWWPKVYGWYYEDPDKYFKITDAIIKKAEEKEVGIIIDFFWNNQSFFYYHKNQRSDMGNPNSKSVIEAKKFVDKIINRYKDSPAVWGYEIGNEYNLAVDLYRPDSGIRFTITKDDPSADITKDYFTTNELSVFYTEIASEIRFLDSDRFITTGDAAARKHSYSLYSATKDIYFNNHKSWKENWSVTTNYKDMISKLNPNPVNTISTHLYTGYFKSGGSISGGTFDEYLKIYIDKAKEMKKGLYVGEFDGPCSSASDGGKSAIKAIKNSSIQLSSPWLAGSDGRLLKVSCTTANKSEFEELIKNDIYNYNKEYQSVFDSAWNSWKKTIKVNSNNASYTITKSNNYTTNAKSDYYLEKDTIKLTVTPKSGYKVKSISVKTTSGNTVKYSNNQFIMPNGDVVINISTEKIESNKPSDTKIDDSKSEIVTPAEEEKEEVIEEQSEYYKIKDREFIIQVSIAVGILVILLLLFELFTKNKKDE